MRKNSLAGVLVFLPLFLFTVATVDAAMPGTTVAQTATNTPMTATTTTSTTTSATVATATMAAAPDQQSVEQRVRAYFSDIPVMIEIARCESKFRQFTDSGNVLRGGAGGQMVGVFQFFDRYHSSPAYALGYDLETIEGNLAYARRIYQTEGTSPWNSARDCFTSGATQASASATNNQLRNTNEQQIELLLKIISLLKILLERKLALQ